MKWSVIGLFGLGFVASVCAVVLVVTLRQSPTSAEDVADSAPAPEPQRTVLVAQRDLEPRHVLRAGDLEEREVDESAVPKGAFSDSVQLVGRVLVTPMAAGQVFRDTSFAEDGSGLQLAATLTEGRRGYVLTLEDDLTTESMLYPGCVVDVVTAIDVKKPDEMSVSDRVSFTLIQGAMVLAVREETILSASRESGSSGSPESTAPRVRNTVVTLLVTPTEASSLRLAEDKGSISLVLRNPLDDTLVDPAGTRLSRLLPLMDEEKAAAERRLVDELKRELALARVELERSNEAFAEERAAMQAEYAELAALTREEPEPVERTWETTVLRGSESTKRKFTVDANED